MSAPSSIYGRGLPPFGREMLAAKRRGQRINLFVHAGDHSWRRAKARPLGERICVPDDDYMSLDWSCVAGLELVLVVWNRPPDFVAELARHLVRSGAAMVVAIGDRGDVCSRMVYKPAPRAA